LAGIGELENQLLIQEERFKDTQKKVDRIIKSLKLPDEIATNLYTLAESSEVTNELYAPLTPVIKKLNEEEQIIALLKKKIETEMVSAGITPPK